MQRFGYIMQRNIGINHCRESSHDMCKFA